MNVQERLQRIKQDYETVLAETSGYDLASLDGYDMEWLFEIVEEQQKEIEGLQKLVNYHQEKQKEAEDENELYRHENARLQKEIDRLNDALKGAAHMANISSKTIGDYRNENARLREALERIGDPITKVTSADMMELKQLARKALKNDTRHISK